MTGIERAQLVVLIIFGINTVLLLGLFILKAAHRRSMVHRERLRVEYVALLSRHITYEHCTDPIDASMVQDSAFLDALIDVRDAVVGPEAQTLRDIAGQHGVLERQAAFLRARHPLGRRLRAAVALAEIGDESVAGLLMEHLTDLEPEIRIQCARGLGRMQWTPAIEAIVTGFNKQTPWVRARFADTLIGFGRKATWPLLAYVKVNQAFDPVGPALAIRTLATIGDEQAVKPLLSLLDEAVDVEVVIATIETLGHLQNPLAVPQIQKLCSADDWRLRAKAASALGDLSDVTGTALLSQLIRDENLWVRRNSAAALTRIPGGESSLHSALMGDDPYAADAATQALTDSGALTAARDRLDRDVATSLDRALLERISDMGEVSV